MARTRLPAEQRKKQLLKCAVGVFARSNYRTARVADIAVQAGVSEAAVYRHFPSKKTIYLEILQHMSSRIITFWQEEVDREPDAFKALRNMGMTYYRRMVKHPHELKVQFQATAEVSDPEIGERLRQDHRKYMTFIRKVIQKGIRQGLIRKDVDASALSWLFNGVGITMNMMNLLSFKQEFNDKFVTKIIDHLMESIKP